MWFLDSDSRSKFGEGNRRRSSPRQPILMVNARMSEQRRERNHKVGAIVLLIVSVTLLVLATVSGAHLVGNSLFARNDQFIIRHLDLKSNGRLLPLHLMEYGHISEGMNLFAVDIQKVRKDLESVPLISKAEVYRELPDTLVVRVTERSAIARIGRDDKKFVLAVDREAYVLGPTARAPNLPVITGMSEKGLTPGSIVQDSSVRDALVAIDLCESSEVGRTVKIISVDTSNPEYLDIRLAQGERVLMSRENIRLKLERLDESLKTAANVGEVIASIDLTVDRNFPIRYRER